MLTFWAWSCSTGAGKNDGPKQVDTIFKKVRLPNLALLLAPMPEEEKKKEAAKKPLYAYPERSFINFPFDGWLTEVRSQDSIAAIVEQLKALRHSVFSKAEKVSFNPADKWTLLDYSVENIDGCQIDRRDSTMRYFSSKGNQYLLTGRDIFEIFDISDPRLPFGYYPVVLGLGSRNHAYWSASLIGGEILSVQFIDSFPNGNQTCFHYEKIYRFARIKE